MASFSVDGPSRQDLDDFDYHVGHYVVAVATQLWADGVPVAHVNIEAPHVLDGELHEGEVWAFFSSEFRRQLCPVPEGECSLEWDAVSGWSLVRALTNTATERRYLGQGLSPAPERVAVFATAMQVDPSSAGSLDRPFYRTAGPPYDDLIKRLAPYLPAHRWRHQEAFAYARATHFERCVVTALAANNPATVLNLPLLPGEFMALELVLQWAESSFVSGESPVLLALLDDIRQRRGLDPARVTDCQTNLEAARDRLQDLRQRDGARRDSRN